MNTQLYQMIVHERGVELRRTAEQTRLARDASRRRRQVRDRSPVTRPGMHPRRVSPRDMTALEVQRANGGAQ